MTAERNASFFFATDLRELAVNPEEFDPYLSPLPGNDWPMHLTVCPPVQEVLGINPDRVFADFGNAVKKLYEFDVFPIGDASFDDGETRVTLVDGGQPIHLMAIGALETHGYHDYYSHDHIGPNYNGHISHQVGILPPRQPIRISSVSLFRKVNGKKFAERRFVLKKP